MLVAVDSSSSSSLLGEEPTIRQQPLQEDWEMEASCDIEEQLLQSPPQQKPAGLPPLVPKPNQMIKSSSADLARISRASLGLAVG